jgi:hypothetical protein
MRDQPETVFGEKIQQEESKQQMSKVSPKSSSFHQKMLE